MSVMSSAWPPGMDPVRPKVRGGDDGAMRQPGLRPSEPVTIGGVSYPSLNAAGRALGVTCVTIKSHKAKGTLDTLAAYGARPGKSTLVTIRGTTYPSIKAAAHAFGVWPSTVAKARRQGTLDEIGAPGAAMAAAERDRLRTVGRAMLEPLWLRRSTPTQRIAAALGVSRAALRGRARELGLPCRSTLRSAHRSNVLFVEMWQAGVVARDIMRALDIDTPEAFQRRRRRLGLPDRRTAGAAEQKITLQAFRELQLGRAMQADGAVS